MMANIEYIRGDTDSALAILDKYLQNLIEKAGLSDYLFVLNLKGWFIMQSGLIDQAVDIFRNGLGLSEDPEIEIENRSSHIARFNGSLSIAFGKKNKDDISKQYLDKVKETITGSEFNYMDYEFLRIYNAAYDILSNDYDSAILRFRPSYDRRYSMRPFYLARAYELSGDIGKAIDFYTIVSESIEPYFGGLLFHESRKKLEELSEKDVRRKT